MLGDLESISGTVATVLEGGAQPAPAAGESGVMDLQPLSDDDLLGMSREVTSELEAQVEGLQREVQALRMRSAALETAWAEVYKGVVGIEDSEPVPSDPRDSRVAIVAASAAESIECIIQAFKGVAAATGDELGESVPKIRMMIQDAILETQKGKADPGRRVEKIKRQLRAWRMFLYLVIKTFLEAHSHSTKLGTKKVFDLMEKKLFEPVKRGRREKEPDAEEIRKRFDQIGDSIRGSHKKVFLPIFQEFVKKKLAELS
jgi:hypothetical protein